MSFRIYIQKKRLFCPPKTTLVRKNYVHGFPHLARGKKANNSSAKSTSPKTFSFVSSRDARRTAAKIAAFRLSVPCVPAKRGFPQSNACIQVIGKKRRGQGKRATMPS